MPTPTRWSCDTCDSESSDEESFSTCQGCDCETCNDCSNYCENCSESYCNECYNSDHQHSEPDTCSDYDYGDHGLLSNDHDLEWSKKAAPGEADRFKIGIKNDNKPVYLGVELEIEQAESDRAVWKITSEHLEGIHVLKEDGSLNDGTEIVTEPCTYDYHRSIIKWSDILKGLRGIGAKSHDGGRCGIHIHMSKPTHEISRKLVCFFAANFNKLHKFSRRSSESLDRWAEIRSWKRSPIETYSNWGTGEKYRSIAIWSKTLEFRLFRGTLKAETFKANLDLVESLRLFCENHSLITCHNPINSWAVYCYWLRKQGRFTALCNYMMLKGLMRDDRPRSRDKKLPILNLIAQSEGQSVSLT